MVYSENAELRLYKWVSHLLSHSADGRAERWYSTAME